MEFVPITWDCTDTLSITNDITAYNVDVVRLTVPRNGNLKVSIYTYLSTA